MIASYHDTKSGVVLEQPTPMEPRPKRGALCCGFCCDMRRAVIILSLISIVFGLISIPLTAATINYWNAIKDTGVYDEELVRTFDALIEEYRVRAIAFLCVSIFASICGLVGATRFVAWPVYVPILWYVLSLVLDWAFSIKVANDLGVGIPLFDLLLTTAISIAFVYPHVGFVMEVKKGIMSAEAYIYEEASCCCV